jgi:hypothetical protein
MNLPSPQKKLRVMNACLVFLSLSGIIGLGVWDGSHYSVTEISLEGAPPGIVFIADPHLRPENFDRTREIIAEINRMEPSVVLIGGDFGFEQGDDLSLQEVWGELNAPVYAVLGNHDYLTGIEGTGVNGRISWARETVLRCQGYDTSRFYSNPDVAYADKVEQALEENGVVVLRNEVVELDLGGTRTTLVGVDDVWAQRAHPPDIPDTGSFVIYLVHEPYFRVDWNADLVLAGHTHGGQFYNPFFAVCDQFGFTDISGLSDKNGTPLYITRGIGTSASRDEIRIFASPEIVLLTPST